jgi:hypothetical protein
MVQRTCSEERNAVCLGTYCIYAQRSMHVRLYELSAMGVTAVTVACFEVVSNSRYKHHMHASNHKQASLIEEAVNECSELHYRIL